MNDVNDVLMPLRSTIHRFYRGWRTIFTVEVVAGWNLFYSLATLSFVALMTHHHYRLGWLVVYMFTLLIQAVIYIKLFT